MTTPTGPSDHPAISEEQYAIAQTYVVENIDELLFWCDLTEILEQPFVRPERDHPSEREIHQLAKIEGIPLRHTLRLNDADLMSLDLPALGPGEGAEHILALISRP